MRTNSLFPPEEAETKVLENLRKQEEKLRLMLDEVSTRQTRLGAFEWRYEFPEIMDSKGEFVGFDCIIGNPPYGVHLSEEYRKTVEEKIEHVPDYEIYYYFISLAKMLLKSHGYLAYIIPNTWLFNQFVQPLRESIAQIDEQHPYAWSILELLDCTNIQIFESATVKNTVLLMQKTQTPSSEIYYKTTRGLIENSGEPKLNGKIFFNKLVSRESQSISMEEITKEFSQNWGLAFSLTKEENNVISKIVTNTVPLETVFPEISQGVIAYDKEKGVSKDDIKNRAFHSDKPIHGFQKWLRGFDVRKYSVVWNSIPSKTSGKQTDKEVYINYFAIPKAREQKYFVGKRLLVREITNPSVFAAITEDELYHDPAILVIKDSDAYSLELVCGILNSKLAAFYHFRHSPKATKGAFPKIMIADIRNFPLPVITDDNREFADNIIGLVKELQSRKAQERHHIDLDTITLEKIDSLVLKLYGILDEET